MKLFDAQSLSSSGLTRGSSSKTLDSRFRGNDRLNVRFSNLIAILFFVFIISIFFRQTILEGKLPVPSDSLVGLYHPWRDLYSKDYPRGVPFKNFLITDPVRQQIPWRKIAVDQWKEGKAPLWNPYTFSGAPLLGNIQAAALYPLNILFFFLSFIDAWTIFIMMQPLLAGLFLYLYLRSLSLRVEASLLGAIAWSFSGFSIAWLTWGTIGHVALWLPLSLLSIDKMSRNIIWAFIFVLSLVFQFFAGHAQVSLYFILIVVAYGIRKKAILLFASLLSLSALLTAVQWMPFLDWIRQSSRVIDGTVWTKEGWFIPWQHLVQFIAPDFFGNPTTLNYWGQWNYGELVGYIGIVPLVFAITAIFSRRMKNYGFWVGTLVVALLFALPTPVAYLPFILKVPVLSSLQPTRLMFVIDFVLVILAAYGCQNFIRHSLASQGSVLRSQAFRVLLFIGTVLGFLWGIAIVGYLQISMRNLVLPTVLLITAAILCFFYRVTKFRTIITWCIVSITVVDLLRFGWKFTPFTPREYFFPETKVISFLNEQKEPFRVMSVEKRILPPNTASYFGIESIEGYDPIYSSRYEELLAAVARGKPDITPPFGFNRIVSIESINSPILPVLGARYVLSLAPIQESYLTEVFSEGETIVYEDTRAVPRVYAVERVMKASDKQQAIQALYDIKDYRGEAVAEGDVSLVPVPMRSDEGVSLTGYTSGLLEIHAKLAVPRLIVIANAYNPKWRATIDGVKTTILRTNYAFQGVVVPEGSHRVILTYKQF